MNAKSSCITLYLLAIFRDPESNYSFQEFYVLCKNQIRFQVPKDEIKKYILKIKLRIWIWKKYSRNY